MMAMRLTFLGGTDEIGASSLLLEISGSRILLDCGIRLGSPTPLPDLDLVTEAGDLDAIVVTHGHLDHCGALPVIHRSLPEIPLYATPPTIALAQIMLRDAAKLMALEERREEEIPLYSMKTVDSLLSRMQPVMPGAPERIGTNGVSATFFLSGHILGAAAIGIEGPEGRVLVTGDVSWSDQLSVAGMAVPAFRPDVLVLESTYGDRMHANRLRQEAALLRQVAEVVGNGGKVLIPAFAVGRGQEVLLILRQAMSSGRIPRFPVWVDGLVRPVCGLYGTFKQYAHVRLRKLVERVADPFFGDLDEFRAVEKFEDRETVLSGPPCAIVASSGMLSGGASLSYARALLGDERSLIAITGYQDEEAPGRRLLRAAEGAVKTLRLGDSEYAITCGIRKYHLSAHADASELVGLASRLKPAQTILVHGEGKSRVRLAQQLGCEPAGKIHVPSAGETLTFRGRRRPVSTPRKPIGATKPLAEGLEELARQAVTLRGARASWHVSELVRLWGGPEMPLEEAEKILLESGRFVKNHTMPFTVRVARSQLAGAGGGPDPVALLLNRFGPEQGLYRHSVEPGTQRVNLRFYFPKAARARYEKELDALLAPHGWQWEIHDAPHSEMLIKRAGELLSKEGITVERTSVRLDAEEVAAGTAGEVAKEAAARACAAFREETGYDLKIETLPRYRHPRKKDLPEGQLEINEAFKAIDEAFKDQPQKPSKKRYRGSADAPHIELVFISPEVGKRYTEIIEVLAAKTGYRITIADQVNQHRLNEVACALAEASGLTIMKNPSYLNWLHVVRLRVARATVPGEEKLDELKRQFLDATGCGLEIVIE